MPRFDPKEDLIYVDCGDKTNYAACWLPEQDGDLVFLGWISKRCFKYGIQMKVSADELGLTYKGWLAKNAVPKETRVTIVPCKECHEHPCTCKDNSLEECEYAQHIDWAEFRDDKATPI